MSRAARSGGPALPSGPCCSSLSSCCDRLHLLSTPETSAETLERTERGMKKVASRHVTCAGGSTRVLTFSPSTQETSARAWQRKEKPRPLGASPKHALPSSAGILRSRLEPCNVDLSGPVQFNGHKYEHRVQWNCLYTSINWRLSYLVLFSVCFIVLFFFLFAVRWYCEEEVTVRLPSGCSMQVSSTLPLVGTATNSTKLSLWASQSTGTASYRPFSMLLQTTFKTESSYQNRLLWLHLLHSGGI